MLRGGPQISAQDTLTKQQQQKQKKRLSFKDPEIEGPQQSQFYAGCRPKNPSGRLLNTKKGSWSVENLSLEDQALQIVHSVGSAFSELSLNPESSQADSLDTINTNAEIEDSQAEALINDCFLSDNSSYQRNSHTQSYRISADDREFLSNISPPPQTSSMRCPPIENNEHNPYRNSIPPVERMTEEKYPNSAQTHQIQLLKYQLDQQSQQTKLALHQVQLLTDQMEAESAARRKAREQNNQLMTQNQELLNHIEKLFQQIEDMEKQIQVLELGRRSTARVTNPQEQQVNPMRSTYMASRRLSGDLTTDKSTITGRSVLPSAKRQQTLSLAPNKPLVTQQKPAVSQAQHNPATAQRKSPMTTSKPYTPPQNRMTDQNIKGKETLHIGDTSPPVQSGTMSPFGSGWKFKPSDRGPTEGEVATSPAARTRTGSFSSFSKLKPPEINIKNTSFSSSSSLSTGTGITNKKYSSSTSDLYNSPTTQLSSAFQSTKPTDPEDSSISKQGSISNVNVSTSSKLPRFQPYVGRRNSLNKDFEQFAAIGKDKFKGNTQSSLFSR